MGDPSASGMAAELGAARAELARISAELAARSAEAIAAGRARSEFLATMSHELRTPLNAVLGYAQLLDMGVLGPATPEQQVHLARLQASARHLLRLVDDLLDIAKADAERLSVRADLLVTGAAVSAAVALVQPEATARGVRLIDSGADLAGFPYVGDEHRVRQILVNLLANAVKFTPPGGTITVHCAIATAVDDGTGGLLEVSSGERARESAQESTRWAVIRVHDTGPGIAPEMTSSIFEPFVQGESGLRREQGGTGLGLAISRRLARLMGGDITVSSEPPRGATFTLWLVTPHSDEAPSDRPQLPARRRMVPPGIRATHAGGLSPTAYGIVRAIGTRLAEDTEAITVRYVEALRADPSLPGAATLPTAQLRDHIAPFVGLIASQLMTIGETRGRAPELLADSGQVQRLLAELHGVQRHRLGWRESDIQRETPLILAEVEQAIRHAVERPRAGVPEPGEVDDGALQMAVEYALDLAQHVIRREEQTSLRSFRFAVTTDEP